MKLESLEKLKLALILINIKGDLRQPQNYAMGRVSKGHAHWYTAQQYFYDIERIIREIEAATSFVTTLPEEAFLKTHNINREDYIMYHQGYLLDLVHQLKDKLTHAVRAIITPDSDFTKKNFEKKGSLSNLLKDPRSKKVHNLISLLTDWDDSTQNGVIAKALKKRTHYHHYKNPLPGVLSYMRVTGLRTMLDPKFADQLTEYGKNKLTEEAEEYARLWHTDGAERMKEVLGATTKSVDEIAKTLVKHYKFPSFQKEASLINSHLKLDDRVRAKRSGYSLELIPPRVRKNLEVIKAFIARVFGTRLRAVYITGSVFREDFIPGISDLNLVIITKDRNRKEELLLKILLRGVTKESGMYIESKVFSEEEFMSPENEKERFFCLTDGLFIVGEDLLKKEKTPKVCFNLAWLLNKDFKDYVTGLKQKLKDPQISLSEGQLSYLARDFVKKAYRISFSMIMGNQVLYTPDFKKMRELQNYYYPDNKELNDRLYRFLGVGIRIERETLLEMVEKFGDALLKMHSTMEKYCDKENPQLDI